jgi:hypothetical protein
MLTLSCQLLNYSKMLHREVSTTVLYHFLTEGGFLVALSIQVILINEILVEVVVLSNRWGIDDSTPCCCWADRRYNKGGTTRGR